MIAAERTEDIVRTTGFRGGCTMKYNLPERVEREIVMFAGKHSVTKVVLFGSRARGSNTERSDVDIAVYGGDFDEFYWDIKENVHSLLMFDVIDMDSGISEELKKRLRGMVLSYMKKLDNFSNCLVVLRKADFEFADENEIYRTGIIGQFNLTFELAWKALQEILKLHGAMEAETGSPSEILQLGYKMGFLDDSAVWLSMLKKCNTSVHIYNEDEADELLLLIRDSFIPAFSVLENTLMNKANEAGENW